MRAHLRRILASTAVALVVTAPAAMADVVAPPAPGDDLSGTVSEDGDGDLVSFGIAPAQEDRADDRPYINMAAPPGSVIYDYVAILNQDDEPIDLDIYAADVIMAEGGGLGLMSRDEPSFDAGAWIGADGPSTITVPAQTPETGYGFTIVPIAITIPVDAEPGDHLGGVVAALRTTGQGANTPTIELEQRVALRVYVRVAGDLRPGLDVFGLTASWEPDSPVGVGSVTVAYTLVNTGNVRMAVEPSVTVEGPFGLLPRTGAGDRVDELLPGGSVAHTVVVGDVWAIGRLAVTVDATALPASTGVEPGIGTVTATTDVWAVPWLAIAVLLLLIALGVIVVRRRRRRRQRDEEAPPGGRRALRNGRGTGPADDAAAATPPDLVPAGAGNH